MKPLTDTQLLEHAASASSTVRKKYQKSLSAPAHESLQVPTIWYSTGSMALDRICRGQNPGGIPQGRVVHIAGEWSLGKSVLLDHLFKSNEDTGGLGLCSEAEGSRDTHFLDAIRANLHKLEIQRPPTLEELFDAGLAYHDDLRRTKAGATIPLMWGIDSLDSTEAIKAAEGGLSEGGGWHYGGGKSEALGAGLRRIVQRCARYPTTVVMLNQTRENVGVMFGPKKRTSGGNPPHFYASLEIMLNPSPLGMVRGEYKGAKLTPEQRKRFGLRSEDIGDVVGRFARAKVSKTKCSLTLLKEADFYIDFRKGIHLWAGLLARLLEEGKAALTADNRVIHTWNDEKHSFRDEQHWVTWLSKNPEVLETP